MSTRRARIKAVATLPPRRRNQDNAEGKKKENLEKNLKSPPAKSLNAERNSPIAGAKIRSPPALLPLSSGTKPATVDNVRKDARDNSPKSPVPLPARSGTPSNSIDKDKSPKPERVPVITSAPLVRNIFASPPPRGSPDRRQAPSPLGLISNTRCKTPTRLGQKSGGEHTVSEAGTSSPRTPNGRNSSASEVLNIQMSDTNLDMLIKAIVPLPAATQSNSNIEKLKNDILSENSLLSFDPSVPLPSQRQVRAKLRPVPCLTRRRNSMQGSASESEDESRRSGAGTPNRQRHDSFNSRNSITSITKLSDSILDRIVPLSPATKSNNNREMMKNEMVPDNTEMGPETLVPVPSPTKVRAKLRPVPRLGPLRRNSVQGSASESEDESRRSQASSGATTPGPPRQRHDSHPAHTTAKDQTTKQTKTEAGIEGNENASHPPPASSPVKEKASTKSRRQDMSRRSWLRRHDVKRDKLTMYDLIFYNPPSNPIVPDQDELDAKEANAKEPSIKEDATSEKGQDSEEEPEASSSEAAPVPQIKLGPNGEIILDEKSLVIQQTEATRKVSSVVREGQWTGGGGRYTRCARTAEWSAAETVRFYRALAAIGTDFTLMASLFPGRNRKDLYLKFKKEERHNGGQVDMALRSATSWDASRLEDEFRREREEAAKLAEVTKQRLLESKQAEKERLKNSKEMRFRTSKAAKALESNMTAGATNTILTGDEYFERMQSKRARRRASKATEAKDTTQVPNNDRRSPEATLPDMPNVAATIQNNQGAANELSRVPSNIENGSLVVLTVNDPKSPSKTMLQTYISHGPGKLTPIALPSSFLNSVVGYMKKGTPKTVSASSSPQIMSPNASQDGSRPSSVIQLNPSPAKRKRHSSYTITSL